MHFGAAYYPEHWVYPLAGTPEDPESQWKRDIELMLAAGMNVVRMGEFSWGLIEPEEGRFDFGWLRRAADLLHQSGIQVVLSTPTAAPPLWLTRKHPEILPLNEWGLRRNEGTRRAFCVSSDVYWDYAKKAVRALAGEFANHPGLIAWQVDNGVGRHKTESSFNEEARRDWQSWLKAKYETIERLNDWMGLRFWGQVASDWKQVPMPMAAPAVHNPALVLDWMRFSSDTNVAFVRMQAEQLREITPQVPVTTNLRAFACNFDYFDMAEALDFVSIDSDAAIQSKSAEIACSIDFLKSIKKEEIRAPGGNQTGFWVMEQKAGQVNWQDVNAPVRPGVVRLFTYQLVSRGADAVLYFRWRQSRIGSEQFYGGVVTHDGRGDNRMYREVQQIGQEIKRLAPALKGTRVVADACIVFSHENDWSLQQPMQPNRHFRLKDHLILYYTALHDRNMAVDFARPSDDLSRYKLVIAPSLHLLSGGETDRLKLYVHNGGTLVGTFNSGLVDEHHMAPDNGFPHDLTDLFGLEVLEFDVLPPGEENHLTFKGSFPTSHLHPAQIWCDVIEPKGCQPLAVYSRDFYSGRPAITMNSFGQGKAIYVGTQSHQSFYYDLIVWVRQQLHLHPLLKVPDTVEVSMRQNDQRKIYFLLNHQNSPVRIQFYKPMHDLLTEKTVSGNLDLPAHGVLVLDEPAHA